MTAVPGLFITFEGIDGCGKTTQIAYAAEYLRDKGLDVLQTREPGGCRISEQLRGVLLDTENTGMDPVTEALLYAAARRQHVEEVIAPARAQGRTVLSDRFLDSSLAYQGYGRGLGREVVLQMNEPAVQSCTPDATIFLDCLPAEARERSDTFDAPDRVESSTAAFFRRVREGFIELCDLYPERIVRIDAADSVETTRQKVRQALDEILRRKGADLA